MKKLFSILIIAVLLLPTISIPIFAAEPASETDIFNNETSEAEPKETADSGTGENKETDGDKSKVTSEDFFKVVVDFINGLGDWKKIIEKLYFIPEVLDWFSDHKDYDREITGNVKDKVDKVLEDFGNNLETDDEIAALGDLFIETFSSGGFNYGRKLNNVTGEIYSNITYYIGLLVLLVSWGFGLSKSSINMALDFKDKNSIIRSAFSLLIGIFAVTVSPYILTMLTAFSSWLCNGIYVSAIKETLTTFIEDGLEVFIRSFLVALGFLGEAWNPANILAAIGKAILVVLGWWFNVAFNEALYLGIVLAIIELIFMLNTLWIALLQILSPIFIGLIVNEGTRKLTFNFVKEYFKALLLPPVTLMYAALCMTLLVGVMPVFGLIAALVLGISTLGIAGKKLDKLIN